MRKYDVFEAGASLVFAAGLGLGFVGKHHNILKAEEPYIAEYNPAKAEALDDAQLNWYVAGGSLCVAGLSMWLSVNGIRYVSQESRPQADRPVLVVQN